ENAVAPRGARRRPDAPGRPGAPSAPACPPSAGRSALAGPRPSDGRRAGAGHLGYDGRGAVRMSWRPLAGGGWAPKLSAGERGGEGDASFDHDMDNLAHTLIGAALRRAGAGRDLPAPRWIRPIARNVPAR